MPRRPASEEWEGAPVAPAQPVRGLGFCAGWRRGLECQLCHFLRVRTCLHCKISLLPGSLQGTERKTIAHMYSVYSVVWE